MKWVKYKYEYSHGEEAIWNWKAFNNLEKRESIEEKLQEGCLDGCRGLRFYVISPKNVPEAIWAKEILKLRSIAAKYADQAKEAEKQMHKHHIRSSSSLESVAAHYDRAQCKDLQTAHTKELRKAKKRLTRERKIK